VCLDNLSFVFAGDKQSNVHDKCGQNSPKIIKKNNFD
jgi:hypothetical protein